MLMLIFHQSLLSTKRSAMSLTEDESSNMSWGAGPLWWSDAPGDSRGSPPLRLTFRAANQPWEAVLRGKTLFVALPNLMQPDGSREALIGVLEAAEEKLNCQHVVVVIPANRPDKSMITKTFRYLGFEVLSPTSAIVPPQLASENICMLYEVE
ncbi:LOW QUALITY PROTEIN: ornithine decarboxylase antizyme 2 [Harmonia axyridis]|uniref:LOW QUALITY PROTEIN: ornithine decarboxylase antizyme 2 n=1 Tax=Harmonia axyridis TaxID=115357 RepID=UPI001E275999|nr:LOW QUALITY PROTEIN: ornithine decarboxylase antizyme 2 [Harmonia axyridis]